MELRPILSALYRNKVGAALIALQITLTLAVLCNASFIVRQKLTQMSRPSGLDETDTFIIDNQWIGNPGDLASRLRTDLSALRSLSGVAGAYVTNAYPFENGGWGFGFSLHPDGKQETGAAVYLGDEQALHTLGLKLVAGRNFNADDIVDYHGITDRPATSGMIITRALAEQLFHGGNALGKQVTMIPTYQSAPVVGIIDKLQAPWVAGMTGSGAERAALLPYRFVSQGSFYVVRARPGQASAMMKAARDELFTVSRGRVIGKMQSLAQARHDAERDNRAPVIMLTIVSVSLLAVTAFGIVGLVSFWVMQRRRQIGVRRALGATRLAIVRHFQAENLLITAAGAVVGVALAVGANLWMVSSFSMQRLPIGYLIAGVAVLVALGQLAVLWPALRAASVPPAVATRTI